MLFKNAFFLFPLALPIGVLASSGPGNGTTGFKTIQPGFKAILGEHPKLDLLLENMTYPFAHEAPVYMPDTGDLFIVGNYQTPTGGQPIQISRIVPQKNGSYVREIIHPDIPMANGAINYKDGILFCSQGTKERPSSLIFMDATAPYKTKVLLDNFHGRHFSSLNDPEVHSDGSIWFTDPTYGYDQGFGAKPDLPNQVYRFDPETGDVRAMADQFGQPNGIAFSPDESIVYVTDTDAQRGNGDKNPQRAATIYAFDVKYYSGAPFLVNRRVFAYADNGIPDGVKTDTEGNVYSGCGDGIHVWSPAGVLLGKILLPDISANLAFAEPGEMFALNEYRLWKVTLSQHVQGTILDQSRDDQ
ncbi:hypothetical protein BDW71DRAFT_181864 [Aspergillus fruticulosus]